MQDEDEILNAVEKYVDTIIATEYYLLQLEMDRGVETLSKVIPPELINSVEQYIFAAGAIYFAGMDITKSSMQNLFVAADLLPDKALIEGVDMLHFRNRLSYVLAIAFLDSLDKKVTQENLMNVVSALGFEPDLNKAKETIDIYNKIAVQHGLNPVSQIQ